MRQLFILFIALFSQTVVAATNHALIVGVSEYPNLEPGLSLNGPKYDALRVQSMLLQQGVAEGNIELLADGVEGSMLPTKQNIIDAIFAIEKDLSEGDFVYLHFSGHGSQQPVKDLQDSNDAIDGLDEIFLPRDVASWSKERGEVPNSITDDEINILTTRLRNKGANVWVVFDSCHSGTMTRSLNGQSVKSRNVSLEQLKGSRPAEKQGIAEGGNDYGLSPVTLTAQAGALISFGAAQSNEEAPEMDLSFGESKSPQGLFTHTLTSLISQNPNLSYRQLAQSVLSAYNGFPWYRTTPLFEGKELDTPIFHRSGEVHVRYPMKKAKGQYFIQAGQINGLEKGAVIEVFTDVSAQEPLAVMEITKSELATSEAVLRTGEVNKKRVFAQLQSPAYPSAITFKWQESPNQAWQSALSNHLKTNDFLNRTIEWVEEDKSADVSVYVAEDRVYFFTLANIELPCELDSTKAKACQASNPESQESYLSLPIADSTPSDILNNGLIRLVRAHNLKRLSAKLTGKSSILSEVFLNEEPVELENVVVAGDGDELQMSFVNQTRKPVDLTVMFIDSGLGITQVFPEPGYSGRLFAGEFAEFEGEVSNEDTTGEEQFIVIAVPASREAPTVSLAHLQQEPLESSSFEKRVRTKSRSIGSTEDLFAQALGDLPQQRAFNKREKSSDKAAISVIRLQTH